MAGGQLSAKVIELAQRRLMALQLRRQGGSFRQIAAQMSKIEGISPDYSEAQAHRDVKAELGRINRMCRDDAEECRQLELERLGELFARLWPGALKGDLAAMDRCLAIMRRQAELEGYNPTAKVQVGGIPKGEGGVPIQITEVIVERPAADPAEEPAGSESSSE